jgi:hypothetical protein
VIYFRSFKEARMIRLLSVALAAFLAMTGIAYAQCDDGPPPPPPAATPST